MTDSPSSSPVSETPEPPSRRSLADVTAKVLIAGSKIALARRTVEAHTNAPHTESLSAAATVLEDAEALLQSASVDLANAAILVGGGA